MLKGTMANYVVPCREMHVPTWSHTLYKIPFEEPKQCALSPSLLVSFPSCVVLGCMRYFASAYDRIEVGAFLHMHRDSAQKWRPPPTALRGRSMLPADTWRSTLPYTQVGLSFSGAMTAIGVILPTDAIIHMATAIRLDVRGSMFETGRHHDYHPRGAEPTFGAVLLDDEHILCPDGLRHPYVRRYVTPPLYWLLDLGRCDQATIYWTRQRTCAVTKVNVAALAPSSSTSSSTPTPSPASRTLEEPAILPSVIGQRARRNGLVRPVDGPLPSLVVWLETDNDSPCDPPPDSISFAITSRSDSGG